MNFENLEWTDGKVNHSGIKSIAYWIPKSWIQAHPKIPDKPSTTADEIKLNGDYVLEDGKNWLTIYTTQGKGKVTFETLGEKDCKMFTNKGNLKYPDISTEAKAFAKGTVNSNCVFVKPQPGNKYVVLGDEEYNLTVDTKGDSGDAPGSDKGLTIEISAPCVTPLPEYTGEIKLKTGTLDCEDGVFKPTTSPSPSE
jgi:hypothetical protein